MLSFIKNVIRNLKAEWNAGGEFCGKRGQVGSYKTQNWTSFWMRL